MNEALEKVILAGANENDMEYLMLQLSFNTFKIQGAIELLGKYGYPAEEHSYETDDGYILLAHRIPQNVKKRNHTKVVLLAHGMGGSGTSFILTGPPDALAFFLADKGFDVWLFNARGTTFSRRHKYLNPDKDRKRFWNFSWHEIAVYDLKATINYIISVTGAQKIFYTGHSQGTTILMILLSESPEMNDMIQVAAFLAPSCHLNYTQSPLLRLSTKFFPFGQRLLEILRWYEFPIPHSPIVGSFLNSLCKPAFMQNICMDVIYAIGGSESGLIDKKILPIVTMVGSSGFSVKSTWHYAQVIVSGEFKQYDYGARKNLKLYNNTKPPFYKLRNVKAPVALFYAVQDPYGNSKMIEVLSKEISNVILKYRVPIELWGHLDYVMANNLKEVIHIPLYALFKTFLN